MKNFFIITLAVILCSCSDSEKLENALLWKISGNGLDEPSYLFGTLHSVCEVNIKKPLTDALNDTEQLYLEMDLDDPEMGTEDNTYDYMKDSVTIESLLSKADYKLVDDYFIKNKGRSVAVHNTLKPEFVNMMLTSNMQDCKTTSYDEEIMKIMKKDNKEIFGLETLKDQSLMFDTIPYSVQVKSIVDNVKDDRASSRQRIKDLYKMYDNRDIEGIENSIRTSVNKTYSDYTDIILSHRNKKWIPKIEQAAKAKPTMFAFGVTHLAGKEGIIMLLRKKGYTVEAVK
jgi:uncharacterized protein YbaP (TraB family)